MNKISRLPIKHNFSFCHCFIMIRKGKETILRVKKCLDQPRTSSYEVILNSGKKN